MGTLNPNQTLLQGKDQSTPDLTPAALTPSNQRVLFSFQDVQPPSPLYINVDDALVINAATSLTNEIVTVNLRVLTPSGRIEDMQFQVRPANTRNVLSTRETLAEGYMLSASAVAAVATTRGQTYVRIFLQRGASGNGQPGQVLSADYVTTQLAPSYPSGRVLSPTEGPGFLHTIIVTNPGAGADFALPSPQNSRVKIRAVSALLTTSAAVANRDVGVIVTGTEGNVNISSATANIPASTAARVLFTPGVAYIPALATQINVPLPDDTTINAQTGVVQVFQSQTQAIQAADQWSQIAAIVEEWLDNV